MLPAFNLVKLLALHLELLDALLLFLSLLSSLEGLDITLVVGSDAISNSRKSATFKESRIPIGICVLQKPGGQTVIVVPLLDGVVFGGKGEVFLPVFNQKFFQFC